MEPAKKWKLVIIHGKRQKYGNMHKNIGSVPIKAYTHCRRMLLITWSPTAGIEHWLIEHGIMNNTIALQYSH